MTSNSYIPESAIAITAHPDDAEFLCTGTMARWARAGSRCAYILCTSGDVGIDDIGLTREEVTRIREEEAKIAAKIAGIQEVVFLREPDGLLEASLELRKKLVREIRRFRPEVVICGDPTAFFMSEDYINHPDHRAAALASLEAVFPAAGQPLLFADLEKEGLQAHKPRKVYIMATLQHDHYESIDETIEIKINALRAHKSQMGDWDPEERMREWGAETAQGKEMRYAEAFRVITLVDDESWAKNHPQHKPG